MTPDQDSMHFELELTPSGGAFVRGREANYVVIRRATLGDVDGGWLEREGAYVLLGAAAAPRRVYVGKSDTKSRSRLDIHDRNRDWWSTALVVANNRDIPFSRDQVAELEKQLHRSFAGRTEIALENSVAPSGSKVPRDVRTVASILEELDRVLSLVTETSLTAPDANSDEVAPVAKQAGPAVVGEGTSGRYVRGHGAGAREGGPSAVVINGGHTPLPQRTWRNAWRVVLDYALDRDPAAARSWLLSWHDDRAMAEPLAIESDQTWTKQGVSYETHGLIIGAQFSASRIQRLITEFASDLGFDVSIVIDEQARTTPDQGDCDTVS